VPKKCIRVVSAAIIEDGRYLITQRSPRAVLPMLWEFPGGKVEAGESDESALVRELEHRIGVSAVIGEHLSETSREYDTYVVELHLYRCEITGVPRPKNVRAVQWVSSGEFGNFEFTPADQSSMDTLLFERQKLA
jgi:8-oxo-dGTP diphosphatase